MEERIFDQMRIAIISPISKIEPQWLRSLVNMVCYSWSNGLKIYEMGTLYGQVVHWARDELVNQALEAKSPEGLPYTHFLFLDSDHVFPPQLGCRLANNFVNPAVDMCSAVYYARNGPPLPIVYVKNPKKPEGGKYTHFPVIGIPDGLFEVDAVGFGAVMIKREVFEAMPNPRFRFDGCGEDIFFCYHAKQKGFRIFVDGGMKMGHIKEPEVVTEETFKRYCEEHAEELGERIPIAFGGKYDESGTEHGTA
jgi:hypothetical protein